MAEKNIKELEPFNTACEELVAGKYILAEMKLKSILKIISEDEKLRTLVSSVINGYDFTAKFDSYFVKESNGEIKLKLPVSEREIVAFVFNLLYRFDNKIINLYDFLNKYFSDGSGSGKEFLRFVDQLIIPFKNAINTLYSSQYVIVDADEFQTNYYNKIMITVKHIIKNIGEFKLKLNEKEEFSLLLNSLYLASEKNDKKMVFSLMIGLDYFSKYNKRTRNAYLSLEECFSSQ